MCFNAYNNRCTYYPHCRYPHSKSEQKDWNELLIKEKDAQITRAVNVTEQAVTISNSIPPVQDNSSHKKRKKRKSKSLPKTQEVVPAPELSPIRVDMVDDQKCSNETQSVNNVDELYAPGHNHLIYDEAILQQPLTCDNYKEKFHQLLCREEDEHKRILIEKCNGLYNLALLKQESDVVPKEAKNYDFDRYGYISGSKLDEDTISYINQVGPNILMNLGQTSIRAEIILEFYEHSSLLIGFTKTESAKLANNEDAKDIKVEFNLELSYFDRLHKALDYLPRGVIKNLVPKGSNKFTRSSHIKWYSKMYMYSFADSFLNILNHLRQCSQQFSALKAIMACKPHKAPVLITGSFGTGKTLLLAYAAYQILKSIRNSRVLICCHHQKSADALIVNYFSKLYNYYGCYTQPFRVISSHSYNIPSGYENYYGTVERMPYFPNLIVTTFSTSFHLLKSSLTNGYFSHILLDDGCQAREPESIIPLCLADEKTKIIIAGDHKQVGPALLVLGDKNVDELKVSLLERLHSLYNQENMKAYSPSHCIALYVNFRCHHALLSLPSYLFYDSMLITAAEATQNLHPSAKYPLHFICSSLSNNVEVKHSSYEKEAMLLLDEAQKYISNWPRVQWGKYSKEALRRICIMSTTSYQKSLLNKLVKNKYPRLKNVEILTVFNIQGREFEAVFLSTSEPTGPDGTPKNITKSTCSQYVFNTVLTRAKSLVVCVGNPFVLMRSEEHLNNENSCWKSYIRRCIICKTFKVPENESNSSMNEDILLELEKIVFSPIKIAQPTKEDTIKNFLRKTVFPKGKKFQLDENQTKWCIKPQSNINTQDDTRLSNPELVECRLSIITSRYAEAMPILSKKYSEPIKITGFNKRKGAFDGDIVEVSVTNKYEKDEHETKYYGKVIKVTKEMHQTKYVCKADEHSSIRFYPLDKKAPPITNLPTIPKCLFKDEQFNDQSNEYIAVFDLKGSDEEPQIKELIPRSTATSLLFVTQILKWAPKYRTPLGAVIEVLPRTSSLFYTERLIKIAHDIDDEDIEDTPKFQPSNRDCSKFPHYKQAFTIDPPDCINRDDALSLEHQNQDKNKFELAVLISNVARYITDGTNIDEIAKKRGTTVYRDKNLTAIHMLPREISCNDLSLNYQTKREVLCITGTVTTNSNDEIIDITSNVPEEGPHKAFVTSKACLTYKSAQDLLDDKPMSVNGCQVTMFDQNDTENLRTTLKLLYKIATKLLQDRLGEGAIYNLSDDDEKEEDEWEAHFLVSELMIWANLNIAEYLVNNLPELGLVRRQLDPSPHNLKSFREKFQNVLPYSFSMKRHQLQLSDDNIDSSDNIIIPESLMHKLDSFYRNGDHKKLMCALRTDSFYPQLTKAVSALRKISKPAEYLPANNKFQPINHYSLNVPIYTHFTSPIRRYFDVLVQRLVLALLDGTDINYQLEDLKLICHQLNYKYKMATAFQRAIKQNNIARSCESSLQKAEAFITSTESGDISFHLPSKTLHHVPPDSLNLKLSHMNITKQESEKTFWHVTIASLDDDIALLNGLTKIDHSNTMHSINTTSFKKEHENFKMLSKKAAFNANKVVVSINDWKSINKTGWEKIQEKYLLKNEHTNESEISKNLEKFPVIVCDVERPLKLGEIFNIWLSKSLSKPLPAPSPCLIEIAPSISVCIQHNQNAPQCFSDLQMENASRSLYNSMKEYIDLWSKLIVAEGSYNSVTEGSQNLVILKNASLEWPEIVPIKNCIDDTHYSPIKGGEITLTIPLMKAEDILCFVKIGTGDMICARYQIENSAENAECCGAVYHFVINETNGMNREDKDKGDVVIKMKPLNIDDCWISEKIKHSLSDKCDLQIIGMPISFKRVFERLLSWTDENDKPVTSSSKQPRDNKFKWSKLSEYIATGEITSCNTNIGVVPSEIEHDKFALKLWNNPKLSLNMKQKEAIERSLRNKFQLIQGPPGTGKSIVGAHLVYIFSRFINKDNHALVYCCPSNKAVDVVHRKLNDLNKKIGKDKLKILRLYGKKHENQDFPDPCSYTNIDSTCSESQRYCPEEFEDAALHYKIRKLDGQIETTRRELFNLRKQDYFPGSQNVNRYYNLIKDAVTKVLSEQYDVILCTCNETCSGRLLKFTSKGQIAQCIIDECGMANEPETIAAASLSEHVVLIGDHMQLQPVIKFHHTREYGLKKSLFERYAERNDLLIKLEVQYRMHESICKASSEMFYDNILKTDGTVLTRKPLIEGLYWFTGQCRIKYLDVVNDDEETAIQHFSGKYNINSKANEAEANKVLEEIKTLQTYGVKKDSIAVLTPYAAQKELIAKKIEKDKDLKKFQPKVTTIVESQGDEYDIVILTTVRSLPLNEIEHKELVQPDNKWMKENLGFLTDYHQLNVGITRAKQGLIIIGNITLLKYDTPWNQLFNIIKLLSERGHSTARI
jgi:superfamily I DNA and/or RNA helicase/exoribonuclease R